MLEVPTTPEKPALHVHPSTTFDPKDSAGHATGLHVETKCGKSADGSTTPLNPLLQVHMEGTFTPLLLSGQLTGLHPVKK